MNNRLLISGNMDMILLKLLSLEDLYGYQITKKLSEKSDNLFDLKEGTLYPLLHQLESNGLIISYTNKTESGKTRRYYHITAKGSDYLAQKHDLWNNYCSTVNRILEM